MRSLVIWLAVIATAAVFIVVPMRWSKESPAATPKAGEAPMPWILPGMMYAADPDEKAATRLQTLAAKSMTFDVCGVGPVTVNDGDDFPPVVRKALQEPGALRRALAD